MSSIGLPYTVKYEFIQTPKRLKEVVEEIQQDGVSVLGVDTETSGLDPISDHLLLVQLATTSKTYVIDARKVNSKVINPLLENKSIIKIFHNAKFDYKFLKSKLEVRTAPIFCTFLAERILTCGKTLEKGSLSLKAVSEKYLGITLDKAVRESFLDSLEERDSFSEKELEYAANDAFILPDIMSSQFDELRDTNLLKTAILEFSSVPVYGDMELNGVLLDKEKWDSIIKKVHNDRECVRQLILETLAPVASQNTIFGLPVINLNSQQQILSYLEKMGVRDLNGKPLKDTQEATLRSVAKAHPVVSYLLEYRSLEKIITSYGISILKKVHKKTGRLHANFNQIKADTGRSSSSTPNLQQVPGNSRPQDFEENYELRPGFLITYDNKVKKTPPLVLAEFRACFIPPSGYKIVCADFSQQELRILASMSKDKVFSTAYLHDEDIHTKTAANIFNVPLDKVTSKQRKTAKVVNFLLIYGGRAWKLSRSLNISEQEAEKIIKAYFAVYGSIKGFLENIAYSAVKNGFSTTELGRRRYYTVPTPDDIFYKKEISKIKRQGPNHAIQGGGADVTKQSLVYFDEEIRNQNLDAKILMVVHDEIVVESVESQANKVASILEQSMIKGFSTIFPDIPMKVDAVISDCWFK